eukprot:gene4024-20192_t
MKWLKIRKQQLVTLSSKIRPTCRWALPLPGFVAFAGDEDDEGPYKSSCFHCWGAKLPPSLNARTKSELAKVKPNEHGGLTLHIPMRNRCVVACCNNVSDCDKGIALHRIPFCGYMCPEDVKQRQKWMEFVKQKRAKWVDTKHSVICSLHFAPEMFERRFPMSDEGEKPRLPWLIPDEIS